MKLFGFVDDAGLQLVYCLQVGIEATRVEHLWGGLLALPANTRLGRNAKKILLRVYKMIHLTENSFMRSTPGRL
jgi:hypothetical protein